MALDDLGNWSINKLDMLGEYASAYSVVMNAQKRTWLQSYFYFDAFAGPGIATHKDDALVRDYLQGSPLRALAVQPPFDHLWFVDKNRARANGLRSSLKDRGIDPSRYSLAVGDANTEVRKLVGSVGAQDRALVFLDPYGLQVDWQTVELLATTHRVDVIINFSLMGVLRNLRRRGGPAPGFRDLISRVMKSTSWIEELYSQQGQLWEGSAIAVRNELASSKLAQTYQEDLASIFASVSPPAIMLNSRNSPIYALLFASQNERAAQRIMNDVVRKQRIPARRRSAVSPPQEQPPLMGI